MQSAEKQQIEKIQPDVVKENETRDHAYYYKTLDTDLDKNMFKADAYRACWFIWSFSLSAIFFLAVVAFKLEWPSQLVIGVLIGYFNTMMYHSTHEIMHGNVLKKKWMEDLVGLIGFAPLFISPTFWRTWHNEIHHQRTNQGRLDPESWPMLEDYKNSKLQKILFSLTPGSGTKKSYMFFFYWASMKSLLAHWYYRFTRKDMLFVNNWRVSCEFIFQMVIWYYALNLVSFDKWLWCFAIPLIVQNYLISSNEVAAHSLCGLSDSNDPLQHTITIKQFPFGYLLHNSNYMVEHYLYPQLSFSKLPKIQKMLKKYFKNDYKQISKFRAIKYLYTLPKVYKNNNEVIHPVTEKTYALPLK